MPRSASVKASAAPSVRVRVVKPQPQPKSFVDLGHSVVVAIVGLLLSLIGTGIVGMISLYARQATLTEQVRSTSAALEKHLNNSVDREEYLRRDRAIQKMIDNAATKDELNSLKDEVHQQNEILRNLQDMLQRRR